MFDQRQTFAEPAENLPESAMKPKRAAGKPGRAPAREHAPAGDSTKTSPVRDAAQRNTLPVMLIDAGLEKFRRMNPARRKRVLEAIARKVTPVEMKRNARETTE
jgi:hypothetical protein